MLREEGRAAQVKEESPIGDSARGAVTTPGVKRVGASAAETKLVGASFATIGFGDGAHTACPDGLHWNQSLIGDSARGVVTTPGVKRVGAGAAET